MMKKKQHESLTSISSSTETDSRLGKLNALKEVKLDFDSVKLTNTQSVNLLDNDVDSHGIVSYAGENTFNEDEDSVLNTDRNINNQGFKESPDMDFGL